jgi:RNA polymerase sigma-70 factor (ECF subfamily)
MRDEEREATDLVVALKRREPGAFEELLAQHGAMLYRIARRFTGHQQDAEDVLQDALLAVYAKIDTLEEHCALPAWLRRIVVNTALMRLRTRDRKPALPLFLTERAYTAEGDHAGHVADWALSPEDAVVRQEALAALRQAVDCLPDGARLVYVLAEIEGLPYGETAALLGISVGATRVRLHRARLMLREALAAYFAERQRRAMPARHLEEGES